MSIDEAIEFSKEQSEIFRGDMGEFLDNCTEWLEELKSYQQLDLEIPQHFTKEQSDWIKKYCINRNKKFYNKAIDDFRKRVNEYLNESNDFADFVITDNAIDCICDDLRKE